MFVSVSSLKQSCTFFIWVHILEQHTEKEHYSFNLCFIKAHNKRLRAVSTANCKTTVVCNTEMNCDFKS